MVVNERLLPRNMHLRRQELCLIRKNDSILYTTCTGSDLPDPCKVASNDPFNCTCILDNGTIVPYEQIKEINPVLGDIPVTSVEVSEAPHLESKKRKTPRKSTKTTKQARPVTTSTKSNPPTKKNKTGPTIIAAVTPTTTHTSSPTNRCRIEGCNPAEQYTDIRVERHLAVHDMLQGVINDVVPDSPPKLSGHQLLGEIRKEFDRMNKKIEDNHQSLITQMNTLENKIKTAGNNITEVKKYLETNQALVIGISDSASDTNNQEKQGGLVPQEQTSDDNGFDASSQAYPMGAFSNTLPNINENDLDDIIAEAEIPPLASPIQPTVQALSPQMTFPIQPMVQAPSPQLASPTHPTVQTPSIPAEPVESQLQTFKREAAGSRQNFSWRMAQSFFSTSQLLQSNCRGVNKNPLDPKKLGLIKKETFTWYPLEKWEGEQKAWRDCEKAIDKGCRYLKGKQKKQPM